MLALKALAFPHIFFKYYNYICKLKDLKICCLSQAPLHNVNQ